MPTRGTATSSCDRHAVLAKTEADLGYGRKDVYADETLVRPRSELSSISEDTEDLESEELDDGYVLKGAEVLKAACAILRSPPDGCSLEKLEAALDVVTQFHSTLVSASLERAEQLCAAEAFGRDVALVFTTDKPEHAAELCKVLNACICVGPSHHQLVAHPL